MKKISYVILGVLIGAFATYYFCPRTIVESEEVAIVKPKGVITPAQAKVLNANWTAHRQAAVDTAIHRQNPNIKKDHRWTWWSVEEIQNYLAYAENQAGELGYDMTGVRVYLGVYGKNAGQSKQDYTTMFMVPTGKKAHAKASSLNFMLPPQDDDIPGGDPLNEGTGGGSNYPN